MRKWKISGQKKSSSFLLAIVWVLYMVLYGPISSASLSQGECDDPASGWFCYSSVEEGMASEQTGPAWWGTLYSEPNIAGCCAGAAFDFSSQSGTVDVGSWSGDESLSASFTNGAFSIEAGGELHQSGSSTKTWQATTNMKCNPCECCKHVGKVGPKYKTTVITRVDTRHCYATTYPLDLLCQLASYYDSAQETHTMTITWLYSEITFDVMCGAGLSQDEIEQCPQGECGND